MRVKNDWELRATPYRTETNAFTPECEALNGTTPASFTRRDVHGSQPYRKSLFTPRHTKNAAKLTSADKVSENRTKMIGHDNRTGWRSNYASSKVTAKRRDALAWDASHGKSRFN